MDCQVKPGNDDFFGKTRRQPCRATGKDKQRLSIQLLEVAVDAPLAEPAAPWRVEGGGKGGLLGQGMVQRTEARHLAVEARNPAREGVAPPLDDLEQREVRIGEPAAEEKGAAALLQHALEIAQEFRQAIAPEIFG